MNRKPSSIDGLIAIADNVLKAVAGGSAPGSRPSPAEHFSAPDTMSPNEQQHVAGLMRVNHCGEVCAQALYKGQALTAKSNAVREAMQQAANEEEDHLHWCEQRLNELDSQPSYLNPLWYGLSFSMGALAGAVSDKLSLGFVAATEQQVCKHLEDHFDQIPEADEKSRAILEQMISDEDRHAKQALSEGGIVFPGAVKQGMTLLSKLMTETSYRI
ncbi:MAG: 2-polyprenyl-3-methyl-6-methoxy-1,4-benzoquinone monooxygenase [Pseudomonadales bacterium]